MIPSQPAAPGPSPDAVTDAAWNAVAVASIAYQQAVMALSSVLSCGHGHGMDVADLCSASGLDEPFVVRLLGEADL